MLLSTLRRAPRAPAAHLSSLASMTPGGGVHGSQTSVNARRWRQKPLLRVDGRLAMQRRLASSDVQPAAWCSGAFSASNVLSREAEMSEYAKRLIDE